MYKWSEVARWKRWGNSEVAQSERWKFSEVERQEIWENIVGKEGDSLFYSRVGAVGWDQDFIFLFLMLIKEMKDHHVLKRNFFVTAGTERFYLHLTQAVGGVGAVGNVVGYGNVWNPWLQTYLRWRLCILSGKLVTCGIPVYPLVSELNTCVLYAPCDWANGDSVADYVMVLLLKSWCYFRQWIWNLRSKLRFITPGKQNVSRDLLQRFSNSSILC